MEKEESSRKLQKEIELDLEEKRLNNVIDIIRRQTLDYIAERKSTAEYILKYREKNLEEYKDDEDKIIEYFDHERFVKEEAYKVIDRKLKELNILKNSPYFGKVTFVEDEGQEKIYVGRFGLTKKGEYEPIVVDWRAPVSSLFYSAGLGRTAYEPPAGKVYVDILSKRQFIIKKGKFEGMFDSSLDIKDEILQMVLSKTTTQKLKDIIMTIQAEQDDIIRQTKDKTVVVDGVAGSGKTTVALHRVAYLLYNYRNVLQDKVLILGPNSIFMDYISSVLPSLGEVGVRQTTFSEFAMDILKLDKIMSFKDYMEKILNRDEQFIEEIKYKESEKYIKKLDSLIDDLNANYFKVEDIKFYDEIIVTSKEVKEMFEYYFKDMPLFRRSKKVKRIIYSRIKNKRDILVLRIQKEYKEALSKMSPEQLNLSETDMDYKRKNRIREVISEVMRIKEKLSWINNANVIDIYNNMNKDRELHFDDLAPIIYLKIKLEGAKVKREIKHIVIDEAQDYSQLQFMVLKELTGCRAFTIVGDSNQRLVPDIEKIPMLEVGKNIEGIDVEHFSLNKSYRSTQQIMNFANGYLKEKKIVPLVREGKEVEIANFSNREELISGICNAISSLKDKGFESTAVICRDLKQTTEIGKLLKKKMFINIIDNEELIYSGGETIIPSYFAKGLEFDGVILIDDGEGIDNVDKLRYVMCTRALHELYVFRRN